MDDRWGAPDPRRGGDNPQEKTEPHIEITNSRQRRTLERIFAAPTPNDIPWPDIESLFKHIGCTIEHRDGSKITITKDKEKAHVHRPHPQTQTPDWTIKKIKKFIENTGAKP